MPPHALAFRSLQGRSCVDVADTDHAEPKRVNCRGSARHRAPTYSDNRRPDWVANSGYRLICPTQAAEGFRAPIG